MKIYFIKASAGSDYSKYKAMTGGPPQNVFSAAAATPKDIDVDIADETIGIKADINSNADLVVIFMSTADAYRAYELCEIFHKRGKTVILGGLHTKFNQREAAEYADALILGEVENYWPDLLNDFQAGELQKVYQSDQAVDLSRLCEYPTHIIPPSKYDYTWSVVVHRGCPYKCSFCLVPRFFHHYQMRPIEHVVEEIKKVKQLGVQWVELHSDNLTYNKDYALALFAALEPLNMNFYGETTVLIARDPELLQAASRAGFKSVLLGLETCSPTALKSQKKGFVKPDKVKEYIETIKSYGIEVWGDFLFGFDEHDPSIFDETLRFIKDIDIDKAIPHLVIPFPGSETYRQLEEQGRILTRDWSRYDGSHVVYAPTGMSVEELEKGVYEVWKQTSSFTEKVSYWFS